MGYMHIIEGYLPVGHAAGWWVASAPFLAHGLHRLRRTLKDNPEAKLLLGASGGFAFVLSALKLPSVTGSCSHPTGVGLGAILFGPSVMAVLGTIVLLFQALFLAHGGLTTLGANAFSMAIVGSWVAFAVFHCSRQLAVPFAGAIFLGAMLGDLATYCVTATQLAIAFPDPASGLAGAMAKFLAVFAFTQLPLAVSEGLLTVVVVNTLMAYNRSQLGELVLLPKEPNR